MLTLEISKIYLYAQIIEESGQFDVKKFGDDELSTELQMLMINLSLNRIS